MRYGVRPAKIEKNLSAKKERTNKATTRGIWGVDKPDIVTPSLSTLQGDEQNMQNMSPKTVRTGNNEG